MGKTRDLFKKIRLGRGWCVAGGAGARHSYSLKGKEALQYFTNCHGWIGMHRLNTALGRPTCMKSMDIFLINLF